MKKIFSVILLAIIFICGQNQAKAQEFDFDVNNFKLTPMTTGWLCEAVVDYDIDFLALREGPAVYYREILRIPPGAYITVITGGEDSWGSFQFVTYRNVRGFASSRYFRITRRIKELM